MMLHVYPAQQSLGEVHTPPAATHVGPPIGAGMRQRNVPMASGMQGVPPQHSDAKVHCCPA
jgi:hypothetical protein